MTTYRLIATGADLVEHIIDESTDYERLDRIAGEWGADDTVELEIFPIDPPPTAEGWFTAEIV